MKYICQGPPMVKKNSKVNQSTQHKFRNKIIINTLWESLSILWIIGRAIPDGGHFSSWAFWATYTMLAVLRSIVPEGRKTIFSTLLGLLAGSEN